MRRHLTLGLLSIIVAWAFASSAYAATFYIDKTLGDDTRTSTQAQSKTTPWAHLRCMASATSAALAYTPVAGDIFVLKGGETWVNADFPCNWKWSGVDGNRITVTVDATWYTGGSWSRPIWDAGGVAIAGARNTFLWFNLGAYKYVTFSNIEMKGLYWSGPQAFAACANVIGVPATYITLDQLYIHGWSHGTLANGTLDTGCNILLGDSNLPNMVGSVLQNSIIDGSDTTNGGDSGRVYLWPSFVNNVIHDVVSAMVTKGGGTISGNTVYNCTESFDSAAHANNLETFGASTANTLYIHDNVFRDNRFSGCESAFIAGQNTTAYVYNNLWYNLNGATAPEFDRQAPTPPSVYFFNNTIVAKTGGWCAQVGHTGGTTAILQIRDNLCITTLTTGSTGFDSAFAATSLTISDNVRLTPTVATAQGFTAAQTPYTYYPTTGASTIGTGANLTASCAVMPGLCSDTSYGATLGANNTVVVGARTPFSRAGTGVWDVGPYQFEAVTPLPVAPASAQLMADSDISTFIWAPSTSATLAGYKVYHTQVPGIYAAPVATITAASAAASQSSMTTYRYQHTVPGTHCYSVTAYLADGTEGPKSTEVCHTATGLRAKAARQ